MEGSHARMHACTHCPARGHASTSERHIQYAAHEGMARATVYMGACDACVRAWFLSVCLCCVFCICVCWFEGCVARNDVAGRSSGSSHGYARLPIRKHMGVYTPCKILNVSLGTALTHTCDSSSAGPPRSTAVGPVTLCLLGQLHFGQVDLRRRERQPLEALQTVCERRAER